MRLTIIKPDNSVYVDGLCHTNLDLNSTPNEVHALQWFSTNTGWIEYNNGSANENIDALPAWANDAIEQWNNANKPPVPPEPVPPTAQKNKESAILMLQETDWATRPSVADPALSNPYLTNQNDFFEYQNTVRKIALNPTDGFLQWPVLPIDQWSE